VPHRDGQSRNWFFEKGLCCIAAIDASTANPAFVRPEKKAEALTEPLIQQTKQNLQ
jgi:hypothetical protein